MKKRLVILLALVLLCMVFPAQAGGYTFVFDKGVTTLFEGETLQLTLRQEGVPEGGAVEYTSSSTRNATVDEKGLVTGVGKGQTTITATLKAGGKTYRAKITLTVARKVTEVQVDEERLTVLRPGNPMLAQLRPAGEMQTEEPVLLLRLGSNQGIQASCLPKDATNRRFTLSTTDASIVKVTNNTLVPKKAGECLVSVISQQNPEVMAVYRVLVVQPVTRLALTAPGKKIYVGQTLAITPEYTPETATLKAVTWRSSNEKVAVVDENGVVTGVGKGNAAIRATAADGSARYATYNVQVMQQPTGITLQDTAATVNVGSSKTMKATVQPASASSKKVEWLSSDEHVATVNASGRVKPIAPGVCTITCRSVDFPEVFATAEITVHQLVTKIEFAQKEISVNVEESVMVFWQTSPANATDTSVTLSSNNESIASVEADGTIRGRKKGSATITVKAMDGSKKQARIKVNVLQPVQGVHMKNDTLRVGVDESVTATAELEPSNASDTRMHWVSADTSIATVKGSRNKPTITGQRWGETTITGTTEDGGFSTTAVIKVGNFDRALRITDLYLQDNRIKINVENESNMNITRFYFTINCYDAAGAPLPCTGSGSNRFDGDYRLMLYEGDVTEHGRFNFDDYVQPETEIACVTMQITGYRTDEGYSRDIKDSRQLVVEYKTNAYVGPTPAPVE